jgi:hypothetical protein
MTTTSRLWSPPTENIEIVDEDEMPKATIDMKLPCFTLQFPSPSFWRNHVY